ncbi:MAG TPA: superoxide dismutase [Candidatus Babeliales bacterium]|nr:superoxide dismutase [Candidatus Babeliales bacterium]
MSKYILPPLPYSFGALEPYVDALTMEIHHDRHHQAYIDNLNAAIEKYPELAKIPLDKLLIDLEFVPAEIRTTIRNHGGGTYNHNFFWQIMSPKGGGVPNGPLVDLIKQRFDNFETFQNQFNHTAKSVFGSGWAWLVVDAQGELQIMPTLNQDTPIMFNARPVLGLDVWEHAYYLKYQNRRPDYISAWWQIVNWEQATENYLTIKG